MARGSLHNDLRREIPQLKLYAPKGRHATEPRVALTPQAVKRLAGLGLEVEIAPAFGESCAWRDSDFIEAGATVGEGGLSTADIVVGLEAPSEAVTGGMKPDALYIGYLDPFGPRDAIDGMLARKVNAIAMELIPRTTLAQKMDALSSQANLAGYAAVLLGATHLSQIMPMMMTPAGTLKPARVFVIGVGVAGLQAIATAKRLGARVDAFDTRPVVEEQVRSLGAKFVKIDLGETGQTKDGYAVELTDEQRQKQREAMAKVVAESDLVITTAQVFGRRAPVIVTDEMIARMRPGGVIVDCAVDSGGNVEGITPEEITARHGITLVARSHLSREYPVHASEMYAANIANLIEHFWDKKAGGLKLDPADEILAGCLVSYQGEIVSEMLRKHRETA